MPLDYNNPEALDIKMKEKDNEDDKRKIILGDKMRI